MASPNEIGGLREIMVKPTAWKLIESPDGNFILQFTFLTDKLEKEGLWGSWQNESGWADVITRRRGTKIYATSSSALRDIARVQEQAVVYMFMNPVKF